MDDTGVRCHRAGIAMRVLACLLRLALAAVPKLGALSAANPADYRPHMAKIDAHLPYELLQQLQGRHHSQLHLRHNMGAAPLSVPQAITATSNW